MARPASQTPLNNLSLRLISAALGLPVLGALVWAGGPWMGALAVVIAALAAHEALVLLRRAGWAPLSWEGVAWSALIVAAVAFLPAYFWPALGVGAVLVLLAGVLRLRSPEAVGAWVFTVAAVAVIALPVGSAVALREGIAGLEWLLTAFVGVFATDTGAYAFGRSLGRHRMAPSISPGKTWEGAAGGLLSGVGATVIMLAVLPGPFFIWWAAAILGAAIAVVAMAGDLLESKLKRLAGVKESGNLIPGHGGLLDRMDSLVLVFPLVYYVTQVWPI